jgi:hypothetical protein
MTVSGKENRAAHGIMAIHGIRAHGTTPNYNGRAV